MPPPFIIISFFFKTVFSIKKFYSSNGKHTLRKIVLNEKIEKSKFNFNILVCFSIFNVISNKAHESTSLLKWFNKMAEEFYYHNIKR